MQNSVSVCRLVLCMGSWDAGFDVCVQKVGSEGSVLYRFVEIGARCRRKAAGSLPKVTHVNLNEIAPNLFRKVCSTRMRRRDGRHSG